MDTGLSHGINVAFWACTRPEQHSPLQTAPCACWRESINSQLETSSGFFPLDLEIPGMEVPNVTSMTTMQTISESHHSHGSREACKLLASLKSYQGARPSGAVGLGKLRRDTDHISCQQRWISACWVVEGMPRPNSEPTF